MKLKLSKMPCFGVAGNFTGHLEQAGEDKDFLKIKAEAGAPKAIFPTYIPKCNSHKIDDKIVPSFLKIYPFDSKRILFPKNDSTFQSQVTDSSQNFNLQLEPECGIVFKAKWHGEKLISLNPICFASSNDCSIRKEGAKKISEKKNWGIASKGFATNQIRLKDFTTDSSLADYTIVSYLVRENQIYQYGEDSFVKSYSYIFEKLTSWIIEKFNHQQNEGPAENIHSYLMECNYPTKIFVSIGATRYTTFGEKNYLQIGDKTFVIMYNYNHYTKDDIESQLQNFINKENEKVNKKSTVTNKDKSKNKSKEKSFLNDKNCSVLMQEYL